MHMDLDTNMKLIGKRFPYLATYEVRSSLMASPIPSFSVCDIEMLGTGLGVRLVHQCMIVVHDKPCI